MSMTNCEYISRNSKGVIQVYADLAFVDIYPTLPSYTPINVVSKEIKKRVIYESENKYHGEKPSLGSMNNCSGRWNELAFLIPAHLSILEKKDTIYIVKLGNEKSIKFWEVYTQESRSAFSQLLNNLSLKNIYIRCSTPDFVVINKEVISNQLPQINSTEISSQKIALLLKLFEYLKNKCQPSDVKSFISIKTSNRPDRRYQILYEAMITKYASRYIHQVAYPLRFDVIGESNKEDTDVLSAPDLLSLPHAFSNTDITNVKQLIDSDERIANKEDLDAYWERYPEE